LNIPFNAHFVELPSKENKYQINVHLDEYLDKYEFISSFLNFCLEGAKNYYNGQLSNSNIPKEVLFATDEYKETNRNNIDDYIDEALTVIKLPNGEMNKNYSVKASDLYNNYKGWCIKQIEEKIQSQTSFGLVLTKRGFIKEKKGSSFIMEFKSMY
jgi:hypothetical protein